MRHGVQLYGSPAQWSADPAGGECGVRHRDCGLVLPGGRVRAFPLHKGISLHILKKVEESQVSSTLESVLVTVLSL